MFLQKKTICTLVHSKNSADLLSITARLYCITQDYHIHRNPNAPSQKGIFCNSNKFALLLGFDGMIGNLRHLAPDEMGSFLLTPFIKFFIPFAKAAHVNVKIKHLNIVAHFFMDEMSILERVHTANPGAVVMVIHIPAADAVKNGRAFRHSREFTVFVSNKNLTTGGTGLAARDLESYLALAPKAPDAKELKARVAQLRHKAARLN